MARRLPLPPASVQRNSAIVRVITRCAEQSVVGPQFDQRLDCNVIGAMFSERNRPWRELVRVWIAESALHGFVVSRKDTRDSVQDPFDERLRLVMTLVEATKEREQGRDGAAVRVNPLRRDAILKDSEISNWGAREARGVSHLYLGFVVQDRAGSLAVKLFDNPLPGTELEVLDDLREALRFDLRRSRFCWRVGDKSISWERRPTTRRCSLIPLCCLVAAVEIEGRRGLVRDCVVKLQAAVSLAHSGSVRGEAVAGLIARLQPNGTKEQLIEEIVREVGEVREARQVYFSGEARKRDLAERVRKDFDVDQHELWREAMLA